MLRRVPLWVARRSATSCAPALRVAFVAALLFDGASCLAATDERDALQAGQATMNDANTARSADASVLSQLLEKTSFGGSLTAVWQTVDGAGASSGERQSRGSYRGDVTLTVPGGTIGDSEGKVFTHFRFGQGSGVTLRPTFTSTPNTTAFQAADTSYDAYAIVAQAWYQLAVPLRVGGAPSSSRAEITAGKIDPFVFFDQNAIADDETVRFLNNAFVHNPLLDSGGDVGGDQYGFTPGVRVAYTQDLDNEDGWGASVGVFGSGPHPNLDVSLRDAFWIAQLETTRRWVAGLRGTYRIYVWRNGRASDFNDGEETHAGWGVSAEQQIVESMTVFTRFGTQLRGHVRFDRAFTFGTDIDGTAWRRGDDSLGFAMGFLRTSSDYRNATADRTLVGYAASGTERIGEIYYRLRVSRHFDLTPDAQWITRPGGDRTARSVFVAGVRARIGY